MCHVYWRKLKWGWVMWPSLKQYIYIRKHLFFKRKIYWKKMKANKMNLSRIHNLKYTRQIVIYHFVLEMGLKEAVQLIYILYIYKHIYTHTHTCMHTHTHTYVHIMTFTQIHIYYKYNCILCERIIEPIGSMQV